MDLVRHLRFFVAVAEEGHFGAAAARLEMTQPPVSQGLRKLENHLGIELIRRTSRGAELTDAGRELLPRARLLVDDASRLVGEARRLAATTDEFRWGTTPHVSARITSAGAVAIGRVVHTQHMSVAPTSTLIQQVSSGVLDVAIVEHPAVTDALIAGPVIRLPRMIMVPTEHATARSARPGLRQLGGLRIRHWPRAWNPPAYDQLADGLRTAGLDPEFTPCTDEDEMIAAVAAGDHFGLTTDPDRCRDIPTVTTISAAIDVIDLRVRVVSANPSCKDVVDVLTDALWKSARGRL